MDLTKEVVIDEITVAENGIVLYREATRIMEDGVQILQTYNRSSLVPGSDLTKTPAKVAAICDIVWTPEVVSAYNASIEANKPV